MANFSQGGISYLRRQTGMRSSGRGRLWQEDIGTSDQDTIDNPSVTHTIKQPETRPIRQEQLVAEVKGIYAGLVLVEIKCIEVNNAQVAYDDSPRLNNEQWQALISLHRTLLHEHHDFFLASQHPSASPALRLLAAKYSMPARMWRHVIHSFLEVLRHKLPASLEHTLSFIYLAYSMMALLYETVPLPEDTCAECLGDPGTSSTAIKNRNICCLGPSTQVGRSWKSSPPTRLPTKPPLMADCITTLASSRGQMVFSGSTSIPKAYISPSISSDLMMASLHSHTCLFIGTRHGIPNQLGHANNGTSPSRSTRTSLQKTDRFFTDTATSAYIGDTNMGSFTSLDDQFRLSGVSITSALFLPLDHHVARTTSSSTEAVASSDRSTCARIWQDCGAGTRKYQHDDFCVENADASRPAIFDPQYHPSRPPRGHQDLNNANKTKFRPKREARADTSTRNRDEMKRFIIRLCRMFDANFLLTWLYDRIDDHRHSNASLFSPSSEPWPPVRRYQSKPIALPESKAWRILGYALEMR